MTEPDGTRPTGERAPERDDGLNRRTVLRGAATGGVALPLLAACGGAGSAGGSPQGSASSRTGGSGSGAATIAAADVPVGGGAILKDAQVVVTQPTKGHFEAFTAICTHLGCLVDSVTDGQIVCPCHGSHFSITTGKPLSGPAPAPLASKKVSVKGRKVVVG